nr:MAG TPA: hypothetical protein [Caudoviricetes sp.]
MLLEREDELGRARPHKKSKQYVGASGAGPLILLMP